MNEVTRIITHTSCIDAISRAMNNISHYLICLKYEIDQTSFY